MNKQKGSALVWGIGAVVVVGGIMLTTIGSYISYANYGNRTEQNIKAAWTDNTNVLGQYTLKVQEAAQVPTMYKDDLKEVVTAALSARYGADGSKAVFQFIKENNVALDPQLYRKIQTIVEAGRNEFQMKQTYLIDQKRSYETALGNVWSGFWLGLAGYPKADLSKYNIVLASDTAEVFERGTQAPIKMR
jgi:hypothetical protein